MPKPYLMYIIKQRKPIANSPKGQRHKPLCFQLLAKIRSLFDSLLDRLDGDSGDPSSDLIEKFEFTYDGLPLEIRRMAQSRVLITSILGYLPFSIESSKNRDAIQAVIAST